MQVLRLNRVIVLLVLLIGVETLAQFSLYISITQPVVAQEKATIEFNRDVRPILSDKCFACHGPDAETVEGDLRLDIRQAAVDSEAIVPESPRTSELVRRIDSDDASELMPPPDSHKALTERERETLRRWIAEGAEYQPHWAYAKLDRTPAPRLASSESLGAGEFDFDSWGTNAIDHFVADRFSSQGISPSPKADRITLIRRLSLDLAGIPPTPAEVDQFLNDNSESAYEDLVDRLLASPRFGERMAIYWLDLVRYADTVGYHGDQNVSQSPYRDYVIEAFNSNMPYDQFTREQLAGDLLPSATISQKVASGYNRLNQTTEEGGAQPKEYLAIYFADRVRNVSQVFMGATVGCAQCHDHKFDPYTAKDFYALGAFFADLQEVGKYGGRNRDPMMRVPSQKQLEKIAGLEKQVSQLEKEIKTVGEQILPQRREWEKQILANLEDVKSQETETVWIDDQQDTGGKSEGIWKFVEAKKDSKKVPVHSGSKSRRQESGGLVQHFFLGAKKKASVDKDTMFYAWVYLDPKNPPKAIMLQFNDGNWNHRGVWGADDIPYGRKTESWDGYQRQGKLPPTGEWARLEIKAADIGLNPEKPVVGMAFTQFAGLAHWDAAGWMSIDGLSAAAVAAIKTAPDKRTPQQANIVRKRYLETAPPIVELREKVDGLEIEISATLEAAPRTVVSKSVKPRTIRILHRGDWMDETGEIVEPAIPEFLGKLDTGDRRPTRLDFANWLCEPENVLTSRTMVNRLWFLMFGRGICTSVNDFGGQGTFPSHPKLLDWLAIDFVESGWDIKQTLKTIVTSSTYQQQSKPIGDLREKDPYNELFARQGRFRIDAEMVRDAALATSGLLVEQVGGVSAKPYQPAGYYAQLNFPKRKYVADTGDSQYRRGVYTHWQRTFLHPMLKAFDAPSREECTAARSRSNTPLQALSLLNDPTFVESARVFAARIVREGGDDTQQKIAWAYRTAVSRKPSAEIAAELNKIFELHLDHYNANVKEAKKLIATGEAPLAEGLDPVELAAWTSVARVILNLHEAITRY